jgi:hypothetical protein
MQVNNFLANQRLNLSLIIRQLHSLNYKIYQALFPDKFFNFHI